MVILIIKITGVISLDFKESGFMYAVALAVVAFVIAQSVFFIVKAWKRGKQLGISGDKLKNTVVSSILFTIAPALSILVTVIVLAKALGIVLPWIRLSVVGNLAYETIAAQSTLEAMGGSINNEVTDPQQFVTITWAMALGIVAGLIMLPFVCKKLQSRIGKAMNKSEGSGKAGDIISAAAFIGIMSAFIARAIAGTTGDGTGNAGVMSVSVLVVSMASMLILSKVCSKFKLDKFEPFAMPLSMFIGMGAAMLISAFVPENIANFVWR